MKGGKRMQGGRAARLMLLAAATWMMLNAPASAAGEAAAPAGGAAAPAAAPAEAAPADAVFTEAELRTLLAPFALYPDALLAQLLPATAYPVDIVLAARWLDKNKQAVAKEDFSGADAQSWDPTVKALVRFPEVIQKLNADLDATSDLGDAFVNQPDDVAAMIQTLRQEAQKGGSLKSTPQQTVTVQQQAGKDYVVIEPTDPQVIYVPSYDPVVVYEDDGGELAAGLIGFGVGVAVGAAVDNVWDWGRGWVYPPRWPGYPGYRPGYRPGGVNNGNINIGNDINIGSGNIRPWRPDPGKYQPGQGSKPGLASRAGGSNRPGGNVASRPGAGNRAELGNRPGGGNLSERPGAGNRPSAGNRPAAANRPAVKQGAAKRPAAAQRPATAKKPAARKPQAVQRVPSGSAFSGARYGGNAMGAYNRGSMSRQSISRPVGRPSMGMGGGRGGGGAMMRGGGGGRGGRR